MKRLALLPLLLLTGWIHAQSSQSWFDRGTAHYNAQQYDSARVAFEHALEDGPHFASEFNLGNAFYRMDDYPQAILHWERAARLQPGDEDVAVNLALARTRIFDDIQGQQASTLAQRFQSPSALNTYAWLAIALAVLIGACVVFRILRPKRTRTWTALAALGAVCLAVVLALGLWAKAASQSQEAAILMAPKVDVYTAPGGTDVAFVLHAGTKVQLLEVQEGWIKVEIANGEIGWMADQGYTPI